MKLKLWILPCLLPLILAVGCASPPDSKVDVQPSVIEITLPPELASTPAVTPVHTPDPTPTPTPTPTPMPAYIVEDVKSKSGYILGHNVNLREGPGTEFPIICVISYHDIITLTGTVTRDGQAWSRIASHDGKHIGFMLTDFIALGKIPTPTKKPEIPQGPKRNYSDEDIYLVAQLAYAEATSGSLSGYRAVANVLYNRCRSKKYGGGVTSVATEVYRKNQFSVVNADDFATSVPSKKALRAAREVFNDGLRVIPDGVMYFRSSSKGKVWSSARKYYKTIGGNCFFY
ncbi:MAG: cell wall hydrolase [Clostridia bacterium]